MTDYGKRGDATTANWRVKLHGAKKDQKYKIAVKWREVENGKTSEYEETLDHTGTDQLV